jgi:hypothetical protein
MARTGILTCSHVLWYLSELGTEWSGKTGTRNGTEFEKGLPKSSDLPGPHSDQIFQLQKKGMKGTPLDKREEKDKERKKEVKGEAPRVKRICTTCNNSIPLEVILRRLVSSEE